MVRHNIQMHHQVAIHPRVVIHRKVVILRKVVIPLQAAIHHQADIRHHHNQAAILQDQVFNRDLPHRHTAIHIQHPNQVKVHPSIIILVRLWVLSDYVIFLWFFKHAVSGDCVTMLFLLKEKNLLFCECW